MKKIFSILVLVLLGLFLISACSQKPAANPNDLVGQGSTIAQDAPAAPSANPPPAMSDKAAPPIQNDNSKNAPVEQPAAPPTSAAPSSSAQEPAPAPAAAPQNAVKEFTLTAKRFEFSPATITVNKGDKVRLVVTSLDVPHGISIPEYGINERLDVGKPVTIEFTADKQGSFTSYCSVACGDGHGNMKGKLIVK